MRIISTLSFTLLLLIQSCALFNEDTGIAETYVFDSQALGRLKSVIVYYPEDHQATIPVIYLFNGWGVDETAWGSGIDLAKEAHDRDVMFVSLSAGSNTYTNSSGAGNHNYEDYVLEVIETVETEYALEIGAEQRALCGISNGGGGVLYILSEHPELFVAAGSLSGTRYTSMYRYNNLKQKGIRIDVGTEDNVVIHELRWLHDKLETEGVSHVYNEWSGGHNWDFWAKYAPKQFDFLEDQITRVE